MNRDRKTRFSEKKEKVKHSVAWNSYIQYRQAEC